MKSEIFKTPLPFLALLGAHLIWGINYVVVKVTIHEIPVMSLAFLRFGLACLLIAPFLINLEPKMKQVNFSHLPRLVIGSLLMAAVNIAFFYIGISRTSAINASVLELTIPIISVTIAWLILREKIYLVNLWGILISAIGAVIIIGLPLIFFGSISASQMLGNLLLILSSISFVAGTFVIKKVIKFYSPLSITAFTFLVSAIAFFIPAVLEYIQNPTWIQQISFLGILGLLFIAILSTIVAYFLMMWGLSKVEVTHAHILQYIEPAIAASLAVPLLQERISYSFIVGFCMIALGVYWGTLGKPEHHHFQHKHHRV